MQNTESLIAWLKQTAESELAGCQIVAENGTPLYTPDGEGNYHALWTRDFAYMVVNAWNLIPEDDIKACIRILFQGQRSDGCVPDRVQTDGVAVYSAGPVNNPLGAPPTDNSQFLVNLVFAYVSNTGDADFAIETLPKLKLALNFTPRSERGLVLIPTGFRQSPYGFTDTIAKSGELLFSSLLYWQACREMAELCAICGEDDAEYFLRADSIVTNLDALWDSSYSAYRAATGHCSQLDVWGNAYAVYCGFLDDKGTSPGRKTKVLAFLKQYYPEYVSRGQVRHLIRGTYWERTLMPVPQDTYQNGAYWATASGWVMTALAQVDKSMAIRMLKDLVDDFQSNGIYECIHGDYTKLNHYVVSAVNPLGAARVIFV